MFRKAGEIKNIFTDHYSVEVKIVGLPKGEPVKEKEKTWNLQKNGGWESYKRLTKEAAEKVERVAEDELLTANEAMDKVEAIKEGIKFKAFGKTKPQTKTKIATKASLSKKELLESQAKKIEEEIKKVESEDKSRVRRVYRMKKVITGENTKGHEPVTIRDPKDNELVVDPEEIKKITLKYCQDNLKKTEKGDKYREEEEIKQELHRLRMKDKDDDGFEVDKEDFDNVLAKFQRKQTKAYDFLLKADDS